MPKNDYFSEFFETHIIFYTTLKSTNPSYIHLLKTRTRWYTAPQWFQIYQKVLLTWKCRINHKTDYLMTLILDLSTVYTCLRTHLHDGNAPTDTIRKNLSTLTSFFYTTLKSTNPSYVHLLKTRTRWYTDPQWFQIYQKVLLTWKWLHLKTPFLMRLKNRSFHPKHHFHTLLHDAILVKHDTENIFELPDTNLVKKSWKKTICGFFIFRWLRNL